MEPGMELINTERNEQLVKHNKSVLFDIAHNTRNQLVQAVKYLIRQEISDKTLNYLQKICPFGWDLQQWLMMIQKPYINRLIIAAALLAAEIDRRIYVGLSEGLVVKTDIDEQPVEGDLFRTLTNQEIVTFKQWARNHFDPKVHTINPLWHPIVITECERIFAEHLNKQS